MVTIADRAAVRCRTFLLSRLVTRALIVGGTLALVAAWRLDRAVKTAYQSGWVAPESDDLRLPSMVWVYLHAGIGFAAVVSLLAAALLWRRRAGYAFFTGILGATAAVITGLTLGLAVVAVGLRVLAATDAGWGKGTISLVVVPNLLALAGIAALALATANLVQGDLAGRFKRMFERQKMNLVVILALVVALTLLGDTSGQAIDSIRSWSPLVFDGGGPLLGTGAARLTLGLSAALLLALVVYESGVRLSEVTLAVEEARYIWLLPVGVAALVVGALLWIFLPFGPGIALAGLLLIVIGLLDLPDRQGGAPTATVLSDAEKDAPEWIAMLPLLALAAISVTATVEAGLSGGLRDANTQLTALPAVLLGALAVLFTRRVPRRTMAEPSFWTSAGVVAGVVVASLLVLVVGKPWFAALYGLFWVGFFIAYAIRLFHLAPAGTPSPAWPAYSLPIALGGGFALFIGIHVDPLRAGRLLGVFTVTLVALAFALFLLHFAVRATLRRRPPRLLWWFGLMQFPVLTLVFVWWIGVGVAQTYIGPKTLHDARLVERVPVEGVPTGAGPPPLKQAFDQWVRSQADLAQAGDEPVPLVLVAAHGGGIRAAYWTAAALDCIVGVSPADASPADFAETATEDVRAAARADTCESQRRSPTEQQIAAKRIFLASGVSGGAVGLYAYARQLLHFNELGTEPDWIDERLGHDFAGAAVAWGLFHDVPNRLFGLHPDTGAPCELRFRDTCLRQNRASVLEQAFDDVWKDENDEHIPDTNALLRRTYELQFSPNDDERGPASLIPVLVMNSTLTGGKARAVVSAADLGSWPNADALDPKTGDDRLPLAGTVEVRDALCETLDMRLSTAALLAARFPYVTPSGRIAGDCGTDGREERDKRADCENHPASVCEGRFVDGGYADNSGLFTIVSLYPALRELIVGYNRAASLAGRRPIAPMIVEIDNHYQASLAAPVPSGGSAAESLIPLETGFGSRRAMETYARAAAYRILPKSCTVTVAPSLHPGLIAPLGWELSPASRADLKDGLIRRHPQDAADSRSAQLRQIQARIAAPSEASPTFGEPLADCVPRAAP